MTEKFAFTSENLKKFEEIVARYPVKRGALLPALHLAHEQNGYISEEVEHYVSDLLDLPLVNVREVVTFYSLYFRRPMGRRHVRLCMSISCWLLGADEICEHLRERLKVPEGEVTEDGEFSWEAVPDCLGACEMAPMMQFGKYFEGPLTKKKVDDILKDQES